MTFLDEVTVEQLENDPYPIYERLRREAPVAYIPAVNLWFVTRFKDVEYLSKTPELFAAEVESSPLDKTWGKPTILTSDGPVHKCLRSGVDPKYSPKRVATYMDDLVMPIASACLSALRAKGGGDLMSDYFEPISILSLTRSLGLGDVDLDTLRRWFFGLAQGAINFECDPERQKIADEISAEITEIVTPVMERLSREPDDSALSHMLHDGMAVGETRPFPFLLPTLKVMLLGGMQEPGHGAGSIMAGLLQNPDQFAEVKAEMDKLLPRAVDEGLRWVTPIGTQTRQTTRDVEIGGVTIPANQPVAAVLASASHCESRFSQPGRFNLHRNEGNHAAFGFGHHFCAGRWFARQQITVALRYLIDNVPDIRLADEKPVRFRGWEFRAPVSLEVAF
ncbi:cytochrome P450 [Rhizobium sp. KVB221]|uniref:Cytochrome P450 n=1 Tax=Rhizobium setariae TaxID=2801340 RepID=A0A936YMP4_9HYPH|nr:cytochrome P450 [Rhizobium setariae]MBL0373243.1 cytochrome P450 [Rhizobium setariae]